MATDFADWEDEVAKSIKGIDNAAYATLLIDEVRDTIRDFCKRTGLWWMDLDRIDVVADQRVYDITASLPAGPDLAQIHLIEHAKYKPDGADDDQFTTLYPLREWVEDNLLDYGNWEFATGSSPTHFDFREFDNTLILYPIPTEDSDEGLLIRVLLMPAHTATRSPDFFYEYYKTEITCGIVASLMKMTNKPWSNEELAMVRQAEYDSYITEAKGRKQSGYTRRRTQARFPEFGGARQNSWTI